MQGLDRKENRFKRHSRRAEFALISEKWDWWRLASPVSGFKPEPPKIPPLYFVTITQVCNALPTHAKCLRPGFANRNGDPD